MSYRKLKGDIFNGIEIKDKPTEEYFSDKISSKLRNGNSKIELIVI